MARWERVVTVLCFAYVLIYSIYFIAVVTSSDFKTSEAPLLPLHFLGMALSLFMVILVVRDVYRRSFPDPNTKATWTLLIVFGNIFTIPIYLWKYGFHPRPQGRSRDAA